MLLDILHIGYGKAFFPFLNCTELVQLREVSKDTYAICKKAAKYVNFYGMEIPQTIGPFYDLFHGNYRSFEFYLQQNLDFKIKSRYRRLDGYTDPNLKKDYIKTNIIWNGLVLMEVAYMLQDIIAIDILETYNRTTYHCIRAYSTTYGYTSIRLLETYNEHDIKQKLIELRPDIYKIPIELK